MILIDGKKVAAELREELKKEVSDLKKMLNQSEKSTLVIGSRYVEGGSTKGWTKSRVLLSKIANLLANYVLKIILEKDYYDYQSFLFLILSILMLYIVE